MWESLAQWQVGLDVSWRDFPRFAAKAWQEALRKWTEAVIPVVGYLLDQERPGHKMISVDGVSFSRCTSKYHVAYHRGMMIRCCTDSHLQHIKMPKMQHGFKVAHCNSSVFESSLVDLDGFLALHFAVCVAFNFFLPGFAAQRRRSC